MSQDGHGDATKRRGDESQTSQSRKKSRMDDEGGSGGGAGGDLLKHKNRELGTRVKRLRAKLAKQKSEIDELTKRDATVRNSMDVLNRSWDFLVRQCTEILSGQHISVTLDDDSQHTTVDTFINPKIINLLCKQISSKVPELQEDLLDDEETYEIENHLPKLEASAEQRVKMMVNVVKKLIENIALKGDGFRDEATKNLFASLKDSVALKKALGAAEEQCKLYSARVHEIEARLRKTQAELEDAIEDADVLKRRQARAEANGSVVVKVAAAKEEPTKSTDAKDDNNAVAQNKTPNTTTATLCDMKEMEELRELSEKRLNELNEHYEARKKLASEVESLKTTLAVSNAQLEQLKNTPRDSSDLGKVVDLERQLEESSKTLAKADEKFQALEDALRKKEQSIEAEIAKIVKDQVAQLDARDAKISKMAQELEETKNQTILMNVQKFNQEETLKSIEQLQQEIRMLNSKVSHLEHGQAMEDMRKKLDDALTGKYPEAEIRSRVVLEAELDNARKQIENLKSDEMMSSFVAETEDMQQAIADSETKNARLREKLKQVEDDIAELNKKNLKMFDQVERGKSQFSSVDSGYRKEKEAREEFDKQYKHLSCQYESLSQSNAQLDQMLKTAQSELKIVQDKEEKMTNEKKLIEEECVQLRKRVTEMENQVNAPVETEYSIKRLEEEKKKLKRLAEKAKLTPAPAAGSTDAKLEFFENLIRCPVSPEFYKDAIITTCCHMFARKTLEDNMKNRNRKCPTCKQTFDRVDIKDIYLGFKNNYE